MPDPRARAKNVRPRLLEELEGVDEAPNVMTLDPIEIEGTVDATPSAERAGRAATERNAVRLSDLTGGRTLSEGARELGNAWLGPLHYLLGAEVSADPRLDALTAGAGDTGSMGFIDEAAGAVRAAMPEAASNRSFADATRRLGTGDVGRALQSAARAQTDLPADIAQGALRVLSGDARESDYLAGRDRARAQMEATREADPTMYGAGQVLGTLPQLALPSRAGTASTPLRRIGLAAAEAGGMGLLQGAGQSEAQDAGGVIRDAALTGLGSAALGGTLQAVPEGAQALAGPMLRNAADRQRLAALGFNARDMRQMRERFPGGISGAADTARAEGLTGTAATAEELAQRIPEVEQSALDRIARALGSAGDEGVIPGRLVRERLMRGAPEGRFPDAQSARGSLLDAIATYTGREAPEGARGSMAAMEEAPLSLRDLQNMKNELRRGARFDVQGNPPATRAAFQGAYGETTGLLDELVDTLGRARGNADALPEYQGGRRAYQLAQTANQAAQRATERNSANRFFSLTDHLATGLGLLGSGGNPVVGVAAGAANKALRAREHSAAATALEALGAAGRGRPASALEPVGRIARRVIPALGTAATPDGEEPALSTEPMNEYDRELDEVDASQDLDAYDRELEEMEP